MKRGNDLVIPLHSHSLLHDSILRSDPYLLSQSRLSFSVTMAITWLIRKTETTSKIGVKFRSQEKRVFIVAVSGRAAQHTDLVPGLKVLKVNGEEVQTAGECCRIIREAREGLVQVITEGMHHTAKKLSKKEYCGFEVRPSLETENFVVLSRIDPHGMFPDLVSGHLLWSINGIKITNIMQALKLLKKLSLLKLVVVDPKKLRNVAPGLVQAASLASGDIDLEE